MQGPVLMYRVRRQIRVSYLFVTCLFRPLRVLAWLEVRYEYRIVESQSLYGPYGPGAFGPLEAFCTDFFFFTCAGWRKKFLGNANRTTLAPKVLDSASRGVPPGTPSPNSTLSGLSHSAGSSGRSGEVPMKFILGSIPNGAGTMVLWFLWSLISGLEKPSTSPSPTFGRRPCADARTLLSGDHSITPATIIWFLDSDNCVGASTRKIESFSALNRVCSATFASHKITQTAPGATSRKLLEPNDSTLMDVPVDS